MNEFYWKVIFLLLIVAPVALQNAPIGFGYYAGPRTPRPTGSDDFNLMISKFNEQLRMKEEMEKEQEEKARMEREQPYTPQVLGVMFFSGVSVGMIVLVSVLHFIRIKKEILRLDAKHRRTSSGNRRATKETVSIEMDTLPLAHHV